MRKLKRCWGLWSGRVGQLLKSFTWMTNFEQRAHEWQSGQKVTAAGSCGADHLRPEVLASGHWSQWTHAALLDLKPRWTGTFVLTWPLGKEGARVTLAASLWDLDRTYFYSCCICWLQIWPPWLGPPSWTQQLGNITLTLVKNAQMLPFWLGINRNGSLASFPGLIQTLPRPPKSMQNIWHSSCPLRGQISTTCLGWHSRDSAGKLVLGRENSLNVVF